MGDVIDKHDRFKQTNEQAWIVRIDVHITWEFLRKAIYCWWKKQPLTIRHTFDVNPLEREIDE